MKKLGKKSKSYYNTIEAYACMCAAAAPVCTCGCNCSCFCSILPEPGESIKSYGTTSNASAVYTQTSSSNSSLMANNGA